MVIMVDILSDGFHVCQKARTCDQCLQLIQIGQRYRKQVYSDGGLQTYWCHEDCDKAAAYYVEIADIRPAWGDDYPILYCDIEPDDYGWLMEKFPMVADRFGIQGPVRPTSK